MSDNLVISIDAMGGDNSPRVVIEGVNIAARKNPDVRFLLFGDEAKIAPLLKQYPRLAKVCKICHTAEWVKNGNTGALMAISKMVLKTMQKIHRPAIVTIMPHLNGRYVMLDLGANTECDAVNLAEFAIMGNVFAKHALDLPKPKVALLNIGAEAMKGKEEIRQAARMLHNSQTDINYTGYIEPHEIANGAADVIVADGFTGNVALKTTEGTARLVVRLIKKAIKRSFLAKIGLPFMLGVIYKIKKSMDPRLYNGAMLIGLNGLTVKSHGGTDAVGYSVAIENAAKLVRQDFVATIRKEIEKIDLDELNQESIYEGYYV